MSVTDVIDDFPTGDGDGDGAYTVTRRASSTLVMGRTVDGATSTFPITASVQPVSGRELRLVPEGMRADDARVIYTATRLDPTPGGPDQVAIVVDGVPLQYVVYKVQGPWELEDGTHWVAYAARPTESNP